MTGADRAQVPPAVAGRERVERRLEPGDGLPGAPDHDAVTQLEPPDAAGRPGIREQHAVLQQPRPAALRVPPVGIAAVHEQVAALEQRERALDQLVDRRPCRDHGPQHPRRLEVAHQLVDGGERPDPELLGFGQRRRAAIRPGHVVTRALHPQRHVEPHAAQTDHSELHVDILTRETAWTAPGRGASVSGTGSSPGPMSSCASASRTDIPQDPTPAAAR